MAMDHKKILDIVAQGLQQSDNAIYGNNDDMEEALSMYLGNPDGREIEGRSSVVSTDIADAIE